MIGTHQRHFLRAAMALFALCGSVFILPASAAGPRADDRLRMLAEVIELLENGYVDPVDSREMILKGIEEMVSGLDPHSRFLPPEAYEELRIDTRGEFGGIGIVLSMEAGRLTVVSPIEGTPAFAAGVEAGDVILAVDGESTANLKLWEAVRKMRGPKGRSVRITVLRDGAEAPIDFVLVRDIIPIVSVKSILLEPGYGYVRIANFQSKTADDLKRAVREMEAKERRLNGLILDLRDNPGGLLNEAIGVSDFFLDEGVIVSIKGRLPRHTRDYRAGRSRRRGRDFPLVVLINGGSASASEIVAGAIQDHGRGTILGMPSFGKGSVQTVEPVRDGYALKLTAYRYYTPGGHSIQTLGIVPDIEVRQRYADGEEDAEDERLRERDLANRLEARPLGGEAVEPESFGRPDRSPDRQRRRRRSTRRHGPLTPESLREDHQVMRALEILRGERISSDGPG